MKFLQGDDINELKFQVKADVFIVPGQMIYLDFLKCLVDLIGACMSMENRYMRELQRG